MPNDGAVVIVGGTRGWAASRDIWRAVVVRWAGGPAGDDAGLCADPRDVGCWVGGPAGDDAASESAAANPAGGLGT